MCPIIGQDSEFRTEGRTCPCNYRFSATNSSIFIIRVHQALVENTISWRPPISTDFDGCFRRQLCRQYISGCSEY